MCKRIKHSAQVRGQAMVEFALLIPVVAVLFLFATIFYQGFVQENLYGSRANYERSMDGENPSLGQELMVGLPIP
ncbi:MAG: pilus assembly protein [Bdellovibrionales bacterium]|nr:pilus assembly protein [Bdellovibrionales bacterium]